MKDQEKRNKDKRKFKSKRKENKSNNSKKGNKKFKGKKNDRNFKFGKRRFDKKWDKEKSVIKSRDIERSSSSGIEEEKLKQGESQGAGRHVEGIAIEKEDTRNFNKKAEEVKSFHSETAHLQNSKTKGEKKKSKKKEKKGQKIDYDVRAKDEVAEPMKKVLVSYLPPLVANVEVPQSVNLGEKIVVDSPRGVRLVTVIEEGWDDDLEVFEFLRRPTNKDVELMKKFLDKLPEYASIFMEEVSKLSLPMKFVRAEVILEGKVIYYYVAEDRVDFRQLLRNLQKRLDVQIEFRQIPVRDGMRLKGGLGICGRVLCCKLFLRKFDSISIKLLELQNLSISPLKASGLCGRLMCCLKFESEYYEEQQKKYPPVGAIVLVKGEKKGIVTDRNFVLESVIVEYETGLTENVFIKDIEILEVPENTDQLNVDQEVSKEETFEEDGASDVDEGNESLILSDTSTSEVDSE